MKKLYFALVILLSVLLYGGSAKAGEPSKTVEPETESRSHAFVILGIGTAAAGLGGLGMGLYLLASVPEPTKLSIYIPNNEYPGNGIDFYVTEDGYGYTDQAERQEIGATTMILSAGLICAGTAMILYGSEQVAKQNVSFSVGPGSAHLTIRF